MESPWLCVPDCARCKSTDHTKGEHDATWRARRGRKNLVFFDEKGQLTIKEYTDSGFFEATIVFVPADG